MHTRPTRRTPPSPFPTLALVLVWLTALAPALPRRGVAQAPAQAPAPAAARGDVARTTPGKSGSAEQPFELRSPDGTVLRGQLDRPAGAYTTAVLLVPGTGAHDRDYRFGQTGSPRDFLFRDLAPRFTRRGLAVVRFEKRGVRWAQGDRGLHGDLAEFRTATTRRNTEDLATLYEWTRAPAGAGARCVVMLGHSEGLIWVGRLASAGAPAPALVLGLGGVLESPADLFRWQAARRAEALARLDADGDGRTTNTEIEAGWQQSPVGPHATLAALRSPKGFWTAADLDSLRRADWAGYLRERRETLAGADPDPAPFPSPQMRAVPYEWLKSWYLDETSVAARLRGWATPLILHYGDRDSQVEAGRALAVAAAELPASQVQVRLHPGRGHALGPDPLRAPMDEGIAEQVVEEAAAAGRACRP